MEDDDLTKEEIAGLNSDIDNADKDSARETVKGIVSDVIEESIDNIAEDASGGDKESKEKIKAAIKESDNGEPLFDIVDKNHPETNAGFSQFKATDTLTCEVCGVAVDTDKGLKIHKTRVHGKDGEKTVEERQDARIPQVEIQDKKLSLDACFMFDSIVAPVLPPKLTDEEKAMLRLTSFNIVVSQKAYDIIVLGAILAPRIKSRYSELQKWRETQAGKAKQQHGFSDIRDGVTQSVVNSGDVEMKPTESAKVQML